jgi:hypothetical protein
MMKATVLFGLCFTLPSLANPIVRTASFSFREASYKVEVSVEKDVVGAMMNAIPVLRAQDTPDDGPSVCSTYSHYSGTVIVYNVKDASDKIIATQTQYPELTHISRQSAPLADGSCEISEPIGQVGFFHADEYVTFKLGKNTLSVSAPFLGTMNVMGDGAMSGSVDEKSLTELRFFFNQDGGAGRLIDPANPPSDEGFDPDRI